MPLTDSPHEGRHVEVGDTRLFVVERGREGYPLICLHPPGRDHWVFADYLDGLAPDIRVVLPDLRAHGMSDPEDEVSVEQLAADVGALADELELTRYALLAQGDAAAVAHAHAAADERVSHLVLLAAGEEPGGEYARRTAPSVRRDVRVAEAPVPRAEGIPAAEHPAYAFAADQDSFLDAVRSFLLG